MAMEKLMGRFGHSFVVAAHSWVAMMWVGNVFEAMGQLIGRAIPLWPWIVWP